MTTANIRTKLHNYVDNGDENLLKLMLAVAKEYNSINSEYTFTEEELAIFEARRQKRLSGESKGFTWNETKAMITRKKSA
jgi:hypothetical protein